ncbi:MAG TPA: hypothetical protein VF533_19935 [Solirubrobacteraceae bacterium]
MLLDRRQDAIRPLRRGPAGTGQDPDFQDPEALALDLRGRRVALNWAYYGEFCPHPERGETKSSALFTEVRVLSPAGGSRRLARACLDVLPSSVLLAGWRGDDVLFADVDFTNGPTFRTRPARRDARAARPRVVLGPIATGRSNVPSLVVSGRRLVHSREDDEGPAPRDRVVDGVLR